MDSKKGPQGPYTSSAWTDTATCLDTLHVTPGCAFEVATGSKGSGTTYAYSKSSCMASSGGPGYDKVRSIRVFRQEAIFAINLEETCKSRNLESKRHENDRMKTRCAQNGGKVLIIQEQKS